MTMHLVHPSLSTTGKRKGAKKWNSSEAKQRAQALDQAWEELKKKYEPKPQAKKVPPKVSPSSKHLVKVVGPRGANPQIPSKPDTVAFAPKADTKVYTGNAIVGISTLHKSNAVPVFSQKEAEEIARMRR